MRNRNSLRPYQKAAIKFIREKKRCGLFICPGLGKTGTTLTAFVDMIDDLECGMTLIVAPPRVARKTWPDELREWQHTHGRTFVHITGTPEKRRRLLRRKADFHFMSLELLPWLLNELGGHSPDARRVKALLGKDVQVDEDITEEAALKKRVARLIELGVKPEKLEGLDADAVEAVAERAAKKENKWLPPTRMPYNAIVVDESSKLKTHTTSRWKAMRFLAPRAEYFVILTGTPAANGMEDLWAQIYLLDRGQRLGANITDFRGRWFKENYNGFGYKVEDFAVSIIEQRISDIVFTLREEDYANLPPRMYNTITIPLEEKVREQYNKLERKFVLQLNEDKKLVVEAGAAVMMKLQQLANGVVYDEVKGEHPFHSAKLDALEDLVEELAGQPLLVAYQFKSDLERILKRFKGAVAFGKDQRIQDAWNRGEIPMLLAHPKSAAHGLNLQFGGSHVAWYGTTWSLEDYIQLNKRLHRSGQTKPVMVHHLCVEGTVDEDTLAALDSKNDMQEYLLNALKNRLEKYT